MNINYTHLVESTDPILYQRMDNFDFSKHNASKIAKLLKKALKYHGALGIAANQMGLPYRAFAMIHNDNYLVAFNPIITELDMDTIAITEMCLSFPDKEMTIKRPKTCRLNYNDEEGIRQSLFLTGIECRTAQHETDHLNGTVFTSKPKTFAIFNVTSNQL